MKFGLFYEISVPRPWDRESERTAYENNIEQIKLADELGFQTVWVVEHHFFEEFSHSSAPDLFLTAVARETSQIRLGHGIAVCVPEVNSAVRLAERAATLDLLSGGRLEFGTGRATSWLELAGFGANPDETKRSWDEFVRTIPKMWTNERFGYDGQYVKLPRRAVLPKPYQRPHPPLWVAAGSAGTEIDAAERGLGALFLSFMGYERLAGRIAAYRERIAACDTPAGAFINNKTTMVNFLYCHEDADHGVRLGKQVAARYGEGSGQAFGVSEIYPTPAYSSAGDIRAGLVNAAGNDRAAPSRDDHWTLRRALESEDAQPPPGLCAGDPEQIIEALRGWEETGVDEVSFLLNASEMIPHEDVMESLRLFGREVMPCFETPETPRGSAAAVEAPVAGAR